MPVKNPKQMFVKLLSDVHHGTEQSTKIYQELSDMAQMPEVKEALQARVFITHKMLATLDECFRLIGEKPMPSNVKLQQMMMEDFRKELAEIETPEARHLYILACFNTMLHFRIAEFTTLIAAADMTGNYGVGVLLESCLADKLALAERTKHVVRNMIKAKIAAKAVA